MVMDAVKSLNISKQNQIGIFSFKDICSLKTYPINKNNLITNENYLLTNIVKYDGQDVKNWILYDDEFPLSKRIENILNDFYKK
jgi:hypothetical protein